MKNNYQQTAPSISQASSHNSGGSLAVLLTSVAIIAVGALVLSPVLRQMVSSEVKPLLEFGPEEAAANPVNYLNGVASELESDVNKLQAQQIKLTVSSEQLRESERDADHQVKIGAAALEDLKRLFKAAEENSEWPVKWQGREHDRESLKRQILQLDGDLQRQITRRAKAQSGIAQCATELDRARQLIASISDALADIAVSREMISVRRIDDNFKKRISEIQATVSILTQSREEATGQIRLDSLAEDSLKESEEQRFNELIGAETSNGQLD